MRRRTTIERSIAVAGVGLHSGNSTSVVLAPSSDGILLRRRGSRAQPFGTIEVLATERCTRIQFENGGTVDTVEHLMAALAMSGVTDIDVTFDGDEAPILDGSASEWLKAIESAAPVSVHGAVEPLVVTRSFEFSHNGSRYSAMPGDLSFDVSIDFPGTPIGLQSIRVDGDHISDLADSRTFVLEHEIAALRAAGLALGGGLHNAVVIGKNGPLNEGGFRHPDECVRHKALDMVGDLFLAGGQILGAFSAHRPGHAATSAFLKAMMDEGVVRKALLHEPLAA